MHYLQAICCPLQSDHHPNYRWGSPLTQPATGTKQKPSPYLKIVEIEVARNQHYLENQQELTITGWENNGHLSVNLIKKNKQLLIDKPLTAKIWLLILLSSCHTFSHQDVIRILCWIKMTLPLPDKIVIISLILVTIIGDWGVIL